MPPTTLCATNQLKYQLGFDSTRNRRIARYRDHGGTGIAERDRTIEALEPLLSRTLDGFGEAFRSASFEQIGPHAMLSRAKAGIVGSCLVFAMPGSPRAVVLAVSELVVPTLPHAVELLGGKEPHRHPERDHED